MITVNHNQCSGCGACAQICHQRCITLAENGGRRVARIDHALCSTCAQCAAICPRRALSWEGAPAAPFEGERMPGAAQLDELFKQRRTIRRFEEKGIDRALLLEIAGYGGYAPTNHYALRAIAVNDPALMEGMDRAIMRLVSRVYNLVYRPPLVPGLLGAVTPLVDAKQGAKLKQGLKEGRAFVTLPAAIILIVGDGRILLARESAQYALYNMILYAQALGIGSRINGAGPIALDKSRAVRAALSLSRREHILAALELGYPAVRFRNKVEGKEMSVQWNGGKEQ